ncbi:unnamed protein product [Medioppia subpectinata]|uniref:Serpin domain-containing protein n=1 Tax=Medioppia subpectinata TaxID=1979941 RepID=A0A7R9KTZ8_9ACAR|nr:unnamed protein product [Medioppia subpectinata]CAG2108414.1 unnamed protein product [Medioppia subpectinata]
MIFIHKSVIEVSEEGTEASAATGAELMLFSSLSLDSIDFKVNRPFIYFVRNKNTGIILFMGLINQL